MKLLVTGALKLNAEEFSALEKIAGEVVFLQDERFETDLDVAVTDGFTGNILLKSVEATAKAFGHWLKAGIMSSFMAKMGALLMKPVFKKLGVRMSADAIGGCPLMGVR